MDCCSLRKMVLPSVIISSILLLPLVNGGCSFSQEGKDTSGVFKDMDAARLAAKMALAHQGLDIEAQKAESKRNYEAEPYVPQFFTADESEEAENDKEAEEEVFVPDGAIWDLSSRSNKNSPKQEIGTAPNTSERHGEKIHVSTDKEEETIPVYRASSNEKVVDVVGEEKVWETKGETAPGCPHAHTGAMRMEEEIGNEEAIDKITVNEENSVEDESDKPSGCPYSHKEL